MYTRQDTPIEGCFVLEPRSFEDARGRFVKTYHRSAFAAMGITDAFPEQYYSINARGVLRGLHFQAPPHDHAKIVSCAQGRILDVVVDLRRGPAFGRVVAVDLEGIRPRLVHVPRGCAHGFVALKEDSLVFYSVGTEHAPEHDSGVLWSSIDFAWPAGIWGKEGPTLSDRDKAFVPIGAFRTPF